MLIALGMIMEHEYFLAVFWFLAAVVSLSQISNLIESELNISVSGAVRFFHGNNPFSRIICGL